jgi:hypothetical protein
MRWRGHVERNGELQSKNPKGGDHLGDPDVCFYRKGCELDSFDPMAGSCEQGDKPSAENLLLMTVLCMLTVC